MSNGNDKRSLLNLCLGVLGRHLEDVTDQLHLIAPFLPPSLKMTLLAIARRKCLVSDGVLETLLDESWEALDISGSEVTDYGLERASKTCSSLKAVDISGCNNITSSSIQALVQSCPLLEILRCGGTSTSNAEAKQSIHFIVPRLNFEGEAEDCWETLESKQVGRGASSLKWLVWPAIDPISHKRLTNECPKIVLNPTASSCRGAKSAKRKARFHRLCALVQNQRRAEKAWIGSDMNAKAVFWAGVAQKSMRK
ncbi:hypothetical protein GOP47_0002757 [Adiantum capillus-veneris]|uniref:Uncharacterized protein n=1 Tax=Adiantum capillus-veneris TaxID=13818 RepID=A0A9D4VBH3_ADICA|nr:hypothetical protein GOP47_0002757 [Adiantum capillus-veneris]